MERNPRHKIVYYYIITVLRTYPIPFISLLILITSFLTLEEPTDIFDLIMLFFLFFEADFLMFYTKIKTPWKIRFVGAIVAEFILIIYYLYLPEISNMISSTASQQIFYFLVVLSFLTYIWFLIRPQSILANIIDWSGNSKIARSYRKNIDKELEKDSTISSKYFTFFWGRKIFSFTRDIQYWEITRVCLFGYLLYLMTGFIVGFITFWSWLTFNAIDEKFSRFVILCAIILIDIWSSHKEKQYKSLEKEKPLEDDPHLSFISSVFQSKISYFYLILTFFNFIIIFMGIFVPVGAIIYLLKSENFNKALLQISTSLNVSLDIANILYFFAIVILLFTALIFLFYLHAHRLILENFARRHNNLKPLNYQKYQEIIIFLALNYLILFPLITEDFDFSTFGLIKSLFAILPMVFLSILLVLNYKFGNRAQLTKYREHIIWLTTIPWLISIFIKSDIEGKISLVKFAIALFWLFVFSSVSLKLVFIRDMKQKHSQIKKAIVLILVFPLLMYFLGAPAKEIIALGSVLYLAVIMILLLFKSYFKSIKTTPSPKIPRWINIFFGMGGPYTVEELQKLGYTLPQAK